MLTRRTVTTAGYFIYSALQFITALRDSLLASGLDRFAVLDIDAEVSSARNDQQASKQAGRNLTLPQSFVD